MPSLEGCAHTERANICKSALMLQRAVPTKESGPIGPWRTELEPKGGMFLLEVEKKY